MPRPRLDCDTPSAIQRMINAFWHLLSERRYRNITVTDIVRRANVNRNSFYYHFNKLDELAYRAIHDEVNRSPLVQSGGNGHVPDLQHWRKHVGELISTEEERKPRSANGTTNTAVQYPSPLVRRPTRRAAVVCRV